MLDINARIDWKPGMELSAQTLKEMDDNINYRLSMMTRIANKNNIGILPNSKFDCQGAFVKNVLEIDHFRCRAILPSGRIIDADEDVRVKIPLLYGDTYYFTVSFGDENISFDKDEVSFLRPRYLYEIHTLEEIEKGDYLPVLKFNVKDGMFSINPSFIVPSLSIAGNEKYMAYLETFDKKMRLITDHPNQEEGEAKRGLLNCLFKFKSRNKSMTGSDCLSRIQEMAYAIDYYVVRPHVEEAPEMPSPSIYDIEEWLAWFSNYLDGAVSILDGVVLQDHSIDYEKLKEEISADVYKRAYAEIYELLKREIIEKFNPDMEQQIKEALTSYLNDVMRYDISNSVKEELSGTLYDKLYQILYNALYDALYVPEEEVQQEVYIPQI